MPTAASNVTPAARMATASEGFLVIYSPSLRPEAAKPRFGRCSVDALTPASFLTSAKTTRSRFLLRGPRIERVAQSVAEEIEGQSREQDCEPRPEHQPRLGRIELRCGREQIAPARSGDLDPDAEERQSRLEQDVLREDECREHDDRCDEVREQVGLDDPAVAGTGH